MGIFFDKCPKMSHFPVFFTENHSFEGLTFDFAHGHIFFSFAFQRGKQNKDFLKILEICIYYERVYFKQI